MNNVSVVYIPDIGEIKDAPFGVFSELKKFAEAIGISVQYFSYEDKVKKLSLSSVYNYLASYKGIPLKNEGKHVVLVGNGYGSWLAYYTLLRLESVQIKHFIAISPVYKIPKEMRDSLDSLWLFSKEFDWPTATRISMNKKHAVELQENEWPRHFSKMMPMLDGGLKVDVVCGRDKHFNHLVDMFADYTGAELHGEDEDVEPLAVFHRFEGQYDYVNNLSWPSVLGAILR